jgi:hypothetical protein
VAWTVAPVAAALLAWAASRGTLATAGAAPAALTVCALYAGSAVLAVTPGIALLSVVARRRALPPATALGLLLAGSGGAAMAAFWAWFASPGLGRAFDVALGALSVAVIAAFGRRGDLRAAGLDQPLLLGLATGLAFTGLTFVQGDGLAHNVLGAVSDRYWRTADNAIPLKFALRVAAHRPLSGYLVGHWRSSDRPPLQAGYALMQWRLWGGAGRPEAYQLLSTGLSSSWLPALWLVLRSRGVSRQRTLLAVLATALTGFVLVSTVFVWPKLLAGTFALAALAIVASRDPVERRGLGWVVAVTLAALSMLAHGGTAFALLAIVPFALRRRSRISARALAAAVVPAVACYLPWVLYQRLVDPPGDRLLNWQLAGVVAVDPRGFLPTIAARYRALSLHQLLANKAVNLESLVANPVLWRTDTPEHAWRAGFLGYARLAQLNDLLPAAGLLLLGTAALLGRRHRRALAPLAPLGAFCGISLALWVVMLWGGDVATINHQGAYAVIVLFIALCAVAVTYLPRPVAALVLAGSAAWFAVSWVPGLGFRAADPVETPLMRQFSPAMLLVCLGGVALAATAAVAPRRAPAAARDPGPAAARDLGPAAARDPGPAAGPGAAAPPPVPARVPGSA